MKFPTIAVVIGLYGFASAHVLPRTNETIHLDDVAVLSNMSNDLGKVQFSACKNTNVEQSTFEIKSIELTPNPPRVNGNVMIKVRGNLKENAEEGATMKISIKKGKLTLTKLKYDFCEGVGTSCPVKAGDVTFSKEQWIDKRIPTRWSYKVKVDMYTKDKTSMGCVEVPIKLAPAESSR